MSKNRKTRRPLVAERRATSAETRKRGRTPSSKTPRVRRTRGPLGWLLLPFTWALSLIWRLTWRLALIGVVALALAVWYFAAQMPPIEQMVDGRTRGSVTLTDRNGDTFAWRGDQFGGMIRAEEVSPYLHDAVVATEDRRFYRHIGVDPRGIASAVRINLR